MTETSGGSTRAVNRPGGTHPESEEIQNIRADYVEGRTTGIQTEARLRARGFTEPFINETVSHWRDIRVQREAKGAAE